MGPWHPFGYMRHEDIDLELRDHLGCSHQWQYSHWTWLHDSVKNKGYLATGGASHPFTESPLDAPPEILLLHAARYQDDQDAKGIGRRSRKSTEWAFKWCDNQAERGFGGLVLPLPYADQRPVQSDDSVRTPVSRRRVLGWLGAVTLDSAPPG